MTVTRPRRPAAQPRPVETWVDEARTDARDKVTGRARYVDDLPLPRGVAYAATLRSPYSHARIVSIDSSRAERLPGVLAVLDREHLEGLDPSIPIGEYLEESDDQPTGDQGLIAVDKARFDGDLLGMVVAEDPRTAQRAVELIEVEYELLPNVFSFAEAMAPGAPLVHEELGSNLALEDSFEWGEVEQGLKEADQIFEERFFGGNTFHHPMEPATSCIVNFGQDSVDIWTSTHKPFIVAEQMSHLFGIPPENVRVRVPYIGGGFGAKQITPAIMAATALSRRIGRPVKYVATEQESFRATSRHAIEYIAKVGVSNDGRLVAMDVMLEVDTGAYFTGAALITHNACISAWGCYRLPHFRVRARTAYTNKVPAASFRATGKHQTTFGVECALDSVARQVGIDPIDFKRKNVLGRGEYVADIWKVKGKACPADTPPMDTDYHELMQKAVEGIDWDGRVSRLPGGSSGSRVRGRGLALSLRHGAQGGGRAYAMVSVDRDGIVRVSHNAPDLGTGVFTMLTVVAARTLGIPQSQVRVGTPDTSNALTFGGTSAQRTTVQMGNAVQAACENLERELIEAAVQARGGAPEEWRVADGRLWRGEQSYSLAEIVRAFKGGVQLKALGSYSYAPSEDRAFGGLDSWAPGAAAVEVEVDQETGEVRLVDFCAVGDAGKALHYLSSQRQVEGGAILGLGVTLFEELIYADGELQNADPFQYRMPVMGDLPPTFRGVLVENGDGPGPFGAKGLSQTSIPCVAPAIGNAIRDAIGVYVRSTPFTPEKILRALGAFSEK